MPSEGHATSRALLVQLARLGDLVQSLPAIAGLNARHPGRPLDLLCPTALAGLASLFPGIDRVLGWDGARWHTWAGSSAGGLRHDVWIEVTHHLKELSPESYEMGYVLNQHPRALLAGALLAKQLRGPTLRGPLDEELSPWAAYLRQMVRQRGPNRVHLADAFCGMCGIEPPGVSVRLASPRRELPQDVHAIGQGNGLWVAIVVGAGDAARQIPTEVWCRWITYFLSLDPTGRVLLVGSGHERERAHAIQQDLSPLLLGRVWDATGRTDLPQLALLLSRCRWVVGPDTGPLHLGTAVGARAMGLYFAQARVHETGPYGIGHWVWQAEPPKRFEVRGSGLEELRTSNIERGWPIHESVGLLLTGTCDQVPEGWSLWESHVDRWGAFFTQAGTAPSPPPQREQVWQTVHKENLVEFCR